MSLAAPAEYLYTARITRQLYVDTDLIVSYHSHVIVIQMQ